MSTMENLEALMHGNQEWADRIKAQDPTFFERHAESQSPKYLWVGCSDSRIPATDVLGLGPGELFVHRNVANLCLSDDLNYLSVLQFAVESLKVEHVIVCGHYRCGGVMASMKEPSLGQMEAWLDHIREVYAAHKEELDAITDEEKRAERLSELNVMHQVQSVASTPIVKEAWKRGQSLTIHGWIHNIKTGLLSDLHCSVDGPTN